MPTFPQHDADLIRATVEEFANADLREPDDALRIFAPHSRRNILHALPMKTKAERQRALTAYKSDQRDLRQWLTWSIEGTGGDQFLAQLKDGLEQADIAVVLETVGGRATLEVRPKPCGIRGLMSWAVYQLHHFDAMDAVRQCLLTEWKRETKRGTFATPACGRFIFNEPGTDKPRLFCTQSHANLYRVQVSGKRGRPDMRPRRPA